MEKIIVQGDVFLTPISVLPEKCVKRKKTARGHVLAEGEHTGHAHTIDSTDALLFEDVNKDLYLQALKEVQVVHEEHKPITVKPGIYKIGIVQEYDYFLEEARKVID